MTSPKDSYEKLIQDQQIEPNLEQESVVRLLEDIYQQLINRTKFHWVIRKKDKILGIYLWGEVGAGKTFLLDLLYQSLPIPKLRQHYHVFMQEINQQLFRIQGTKDPLKKIAKQYARKYRIFFLDEFIVNDACNAMILAGLLEALFSEGICLITTSNIIPDKLYEHGFPREPFLPAIESIKNNMRVINLASGMDYRRSETHTHERYLTPLTKATADELEQQFNNTLIQDKLVSTEPWIIYGRSIPVIRASDNCAWFYFHVLCEPPRSQLDYIAISKKINHLFLSNIPKLGKHSRDQASYFIQLIDVMYDAGVRLTVTAEASIDLLYCEGELISEFERTRSRLIEMCSHSK